MNKTLREFALLVVLPLVFTSISLSVIGSTSHVMKITNINRMVKTKQEPTYAHEYCHDPSCQVMQNLDDVFPLQSKNHLQDEATSV